MPLWRQTFEDAPVPLVYYRSPVLAATRFRRGPASGATLTIRGEGLHAALADATAARCRLDAHDGAISVLTSVSWIAHDGAALSCDLPPMPEGESTPFRSADPQSHRPDAPLSPPPSLSPYLYPFKGVAVGEPLPFSLALDGSTFVDGVHLGAFSYYDTPTAAVLTPHHAPTEAEAEAREQNP